MSSVQILPPAAKRAEASPAPSRPTYANLRTEAEAAIRLSLSPKTLAKDRCTRQMGIPFVKINRAVRYKDEDLDQFIESRRVTA